MYIINILSDKHGFCQPPPKANGTAKLSVDNVLFGLHNYCEGIHVGKQPVAYASDLLKHILEQNGQSRQGVLEHRVLTAEVSYALDHGAAGRHPDKPHRFH